MKHGPELHALHYHVSNKEILDSELGLNLLSEAITLSKTTGGDFTSVFELWK